MDDESKQLLREIRDLQSEQMELLRAHLLPPWLRVRFSVRTLLIVMTLTAVALGLIVTLSNRASKGPPTPPSPVRLLQR